MSKRAKSLITIANGLLTARARYEKSSKLEGMVGKTIRSLEKVAKGVKTAVTKGGEKVRDAAKRAKSFGKDNVGKIRDTVANNFRKAKASVYGAVDEIGDDGIKKTLARRFGSGNNEGDDPPSDEDDESNPYIEGLKKAGDKAYGAYGVTRDKAGQMSIYVRDKLTSKSKPNGKEIDPKDIDYDEDPDGEPSERGYLSRIYDIVADFKAGGNGSGSSSDGTHFSDPKDRDRSGGWFGRWQDRRQARKDQIASEKERVKKKGFGRRLLGKSKFGSLGWIIGLAMTIGSLTNKAVFGAVKMVAKWVVWPILKHTTKFLGRALWKVSKSLGKGLLKGMWWITKSFGKGLGKSIAWLGRAILPAKWLKGLSSLGTHIKTLGTTIGSQIKNLGSTLGKHLSGLGNMLSKTGIGGRIAGWFGKGGMIRSAASLIGRGIVAVASVVSIGTVAWIIGIGLALWGAYALYKYFKDGKGKFPETPAGDVSYLRMYAYGLDDSDSDKYPKMFELEEVAGRFLERNNSNGDVVIHEADEKGRKAIHDIFGFSRNTGDYEEAVKEWLSRRFMPAYREFMRVTWNILPSIKAGEIDQLTKEQLSEIIYNFDPPGVIWDVEILPFKDKYVSTMNRDIFDKYQADLKVKYKAEYKKRKIENGADVKRTNAASIVASSLNVMVNGPTPKDGEYDPNSFSGRLGRGKSSVSSAMKALLGDKAHMRKNMDYGTIPKGIDPRTGELIYGSNGSRYGSGSNGQFVGDTPMDIAMKRAAENTGMPEELLWAFAKMESGLDPSSQTKVAGQTAGGLFGFTDPTWEWILKTKGAKYGLSLENADKHNPLHNAMMGAELLKFNRSQIKGYEEAGIDLGMALYLANFFGPTGANDFFAAARRNPDASMKTAVSEDAWKANKNLHKHTIRSFLEDYGQRYRTALKTPNEDYEGYRNHKKYLADKYETNASKARTPENQRTYSYDYKNQTVGPTQPISKRSSYDQVFGGRSNEEVLARKREREERIYRMTHPGEFENKGTSPGGAGFIGGIVAGGVLDHAATMGGPPTSGPEERDENISGVRTDPNSPISVSVFPIAKGTQIVFTSPYGNRTVQGSKEASTNHGGVDIGVPGNVPNTPILASGPGKVTRAETGKGYGLVVYIAHPDGKQTRYAHLNKILVRVNQEVSAGQVIGLMGNTGVGTGVHLHYEVRRTHEWSSGTIDPLSFPVIKANFKGFGKITTVGENGGGGTADYNPLDENGYLDNPNGGSLPVDPVTGLPAGNDPYGGLGEGNLSSGGSDPYGSGQSSGYDLMGDENYPDTSLGEDKLNVDVNVDTLSVESKIDVTNEKLTELVNLMSTIVKEGDPVTAKAIAEGRSTPDTAKENNLTGSTQASKASVNSTQQSNQSIKFDRKRSNSRNYLDSMWGR